ncbi:hypothetical protein RIR_jg2946.t1 [Rhizophagus irregularis DAOM 181602=DAOM 197198]|nr:hypothetical protein RIR_jg2946.t1 [Rhizophagus irregularis DAOM 181602=DAOM 197198]
MHTNLKKGILESLEFPQSSDQCRPMKNQVIRRNEEILMTPCTANNTEANRAFIKLSEFMKGSLYSLHECFGYLKFVVGESWSLACCT